MLSVATAAPPGVYRNSASRPRLPTRMTLFTLPIAGHCTSSSLLLRETRGGAVRIILHHRVPRFAGAVQLLQAFERDAFQIQRVGDIGARRIVPDHLVERVDGFVVLRVVLIRAANEVLGAVGLR